MPATSGPGGETAAPAGDRADGETAGSAPAGTSSSTTQATQTSQTSQATPATQVTPVTPGATGASAVAGPVAPSTAAPAVASGPVARQVFPEVVRLTTSVDGPQRVTIRLNPESLGEVRVVLTQRNGGLEVSLSGGPEARRSLVEGTPELQRLLDAVGRGDSRIVVRDATGLPVASTGPTPGPSAGTPNQTGQPGSGTPWSADLAGGAGTGAGRSGSEAAPDQGRDPRTGSSNATDGIPDATSPSRPTETVTGARPGLDVTM